MMTTELGETNITWSPLLVIRPSEDGALLEDSLSARSKLIPAVDLVRQLLSGADSLAGGVLTPTGGLDPVLSDWVDNGWRPSLEYFGWSEAPAARAGEPRAAVVPATSAPRRGAGGSWSWAGLGTAPSGQSTAGEVLIRRRTARHFEVGDLPGAEFGELLRTFGRLAAQEAEPSGVWSGLRLGAAVYSVDGLEPGVWDLSLEQESGTQVSAANLRQVMADLMCGMQAPMTASATIILVVDFADRQKAFPYERGLRELYVEVGRIAQKFILAAEAQGIGALITPATNDHVLSQILGLGEFEAPVYTITFGPKAAPAGAARP